MAGDTYDGRVRVRWLDDDPANPNAIKLSEILAGVDLSEYVIPETIDYGFKNDTVEDRNALSSFDPQSPGRHGAHPVIDFKTRLAADAVDADGSGETDALDTVGARLTRGCLVVCEDATEGADIAVGDLCHVFTGCQTGQPMPRNVAVNQSRRFGVDFFVGGLAYQNVTVVAS